MEVAEAAADLVAVVAALAEASVVAWVVCGHLAGSVACEVCKPSVAAECVACEHSEVLAPLGREWAELAVAGQLLSGAA